jgi:hypothetical protein
MAESIPPPSGSGSVVLDIGAGTGALILYAPASLNGAEIEISPVGAPAGARSGERTQARTHSRVRERRVANGVQHAAVYPAVPAGTYTIWRDAVTPAATVTIPGGTVTSCHWPG